jgi:hypothetical protein
MDNDIMAYRVNFFNKTKSKNKYNAKKQEFGGRKYDSKFEARYAEDLEWRRKAGEIVDIKPQYKIEIKVNGVHIANYYADFRVVLTDGTIQYHECKGFSTDLFRLKWKLVNALKDELLEPGAELIMIK